MPERFITKISNMFTPRAVASLPDEASDANSPTHGADHKFSTPQIEDFQHTFWLFPSDCQAEQGATLA